VKREALKTSHVLGVSLAIGSHCPQELDVFNPFMLLCVCWWELMVVCNSTVSQDPFISADAVLGKVGLTSVNLL
jgi:hypothetical protein